MVRKKRRVRSASNIVNVDALLMILTNLTGEPVPHPERYEGLALRIGPGEAALGFSQLNELLLLGDLDRVTQSFFAYLLTGTPEYEHGTGFASVEALENSVRRFREMALLHYGNVKFAFKSLSRDEAFLRNDLEALAPVDVASFSKRHEPVLPIAVISPENAYLTGYIVESELKERLRNAPDDTEAKALEAIRRETVQVATRNHAAYLASDHLDVYVATSMRARHEFMAVGKIVREIFAHRLLQPLKLRFFDPTQAYCPNRIDKGLAEALMLRRASCTIYLAQETDTLGKDSELASTLAQGKPVIAYVPDATNAYLEGHFAILKKANPSLSFARILLKELQLYEPTAAWSDHKVRAWCEDADSAPLKELQARVAAKIREHFNKRATTLRDTHPLGIQVNLQTGVANGVLVVRTIADCAAVVRGITTRSLTFDLEEDPQSTVLRERISKSIFRVMTKDAMLTNTFWNFYLT